MNLEHRIIRIETQMAEREKALLVQAAEYERRLDSLNHAHEEAMRVQHTYVTADKYEDYIEQARHANDASLERMNEKIAALENWRSKATGVGIILVLFAGVIGGAIVKAFGG
jgi:predicted ribosome quality control (RQC) complex YloA/Tae2 family protein